MWEKSRNNSIPEKSPSVGDPTENRKRKHDSTEPLNQTQVKKRPKRDVRLPSSLHDFYVELTSTKRKPRKIRKSGVCMMNASGNNNFYEDICDICGGDYGELVGCDDCAATFHLSCLQIEELPSEPWYCMYCCCKFCGEVSLGAHICWIRDWLFSCCLCDDKFHKTCGEANFAKIESDDLALCGKTCHEMYEALQAILGVKIEVGEGFSITILKHFDVSEDLETDDAKKIKYCNSKLVVALSVMKECFLPIVEPRTRVDMIQNLLYNCGSNFKPLNHGGFFTAILEKDDEVISVASIRVHGKKLAEMPFIGTRKIYRWQGMCRRLLHSVESVLSYLGVEELVIPAIPNLLGTWTTVFGFKPLEEPTRQNMKSMSIVVFPGTYMLQKHIPPKPVHQLIYRKLGRVTGKLM